MRLQSPAAETKTRDLRTETVPSESPAEMKQEVKDRSLTSTPELLTTFQSDFTGSRREHDENN